MRRCISCGKNTREFVEFPAPDGDDKIVRCYFCRENRNSYKSANGFVGP